MILCTTLYIDGEDQAAFKVRPMAGKEDYHILELDASVRGNTVLQGLTARKLWDLSETIRAYLLTLAGDGPIAAEVLPDNQQQ